MMGVEKAVLRRGNGTDVPKKHDEVAIEYTGHTLISLAKSSCLTIPAGWLFDDSAPDNKGNQ
jgi:FK506-binding protein 1